MKLSKYATEVFEKIDRYLVNGFCSCTAVEEAMWEDACESYQRHAQARHSFEGFQDLPTFSEMSPAVKLAIRRERVTNWLAWLEEGNQLSCYPVVKEVHQSVRAPVAQQASQKGEIQGAGRSNVSTDQCERVIVSGSELRVSASEAKDDVFRAILTGEPAIASAVHHIIPTLSSEQLQALAVQWYVTQLRERELKAKQAINESAEGS